MIYIHITRGKNNSANWPNAGEWQHRREKKEGIFTSSFVLKWKTDGASLIGHIKACCDTQKNDANKQHSFASFCNFLMTHTHKNQTSQLHFKCPLKKKNYVLFFLVPPEIKKRRRINHDKRVREKKAHPKSKSFLKCHGIYCVFLSEKADAAWSLGGRVFILVREASGCCVKSGCL